MSRIFKMARAVSHVDVQKAFIDNIGVAKKTYRFDISKSQVLFDLISGSSFLFSATGISFIISRKILDYARKSLPNQDDKISLYFYKVVETNHNYFTGNWYQELNEDLIDYALKNGEVDAACSYLHMLGYMKIELGDFENSEKILNKLNYIGDEFSTEHANLDFCYLNSRLLTKKGEPYNAMKYVNEGIVLLDEIGWESRKVNFLGVKSRIQIMQNDLDAAEQTIDEAENLVLKVGKYTILPFFYSDYLMGILIYYLARLESSIAANDKEDISRHRNVTLKSGKIAAKHSKRKVASDRTEAYKLMGRYYWLIKKQGKALKWWDASIKEAECIGAKLELSKTYFEVGKRIIEEKSEYKELNGIKAKEYLEMAKTLFEEMDLQWDLDQLDKIAAYS